jgi:hypothetical protein
MKKGLIIGTTVQARSHLLENIKDINFDLTKLKDSFPKFLNSERINNLGFNLEINLKDNLIKTYHDYIKN